MTPEEFERIKAQEKAHLREIQRLKALHKEASLTGRISQALRSVFPPAESSTTYDEMMGRLQRETAEAEAKLDLAREAHGATEPPTLDDAALAADRARQLVEDMKRAASPPTSPEAAPNASRTLGRTPASEPTPEPPSPLPPRTIGRPS